MQIESILKRFCELGAEAVDFYIKANGTDLNNMPEYFMPAYIFQKLGSGLTATLETNASTLIEWNNKARERNKLGAPASPPDATLQKKLDGKRIDMVLFEKKDTKSRDEDDFLALVEFKRGYLDTAKVLGQISDRDKLLLFLQKIDTCPWGIICGCAPQNHVDWQCNNIGIAATSQTETNWFQKETGVKYNGHKVYFCARLIEQSSDSARLKEILDALDD